MKIVYCLTSEGRDGFESMTRLSMATVRETNPDSKIELACDATTLRSLQNSRSRLLDEADAAWAVATPDASPTRRNRFVKTQLGVLIDSPFLFLDSDTVVRRPLAPLMPVGTDIAGAANHSRDNLDGQLWAEDVSHIEKMGWRIPPTYINGGVLFYAGTSGSTAFATAWHRLWLESVISTGRDRDQSSLNQAVLISQARLNVLPHACNAQIKVTPSAAKDAAIWHYYVSNGDPADTDFAAECLRVSPDTNIDPAAVRRLVEAELPWPTTTLLQRFVIGRLLRRGYATPAESFLLAGDYAAACRRMAGSFYRTISLRTCSTVY